jgi:hypothetical protein
MTKPKRTSVGSGRTSPVGGTCQIRVSKDLAGEIRIVAKARNVSIAEALNQLLKIDSAEPEEEQSNHS